MRPILFALWAALPLVAHAQGAPEPLVVDGATTFTFEGPERGYRVHVVLPSGYDETREEPYPVLYYGDAGWMTELAVGVMRGIYLSPAHNVEPVVLVGVTVDGGFGDQNVQRTRDFTPSPLDVPPGVSVRVGDLQVGPTNTGGGPAFAEWLRGRLFPHLEAGYHVDPERRGWLGHSFGGLFGVWALREHPDLFRYVALLSPASWWNKDEVIEGPFAPAVGPPPEVFVGYGADENWSITANVGPLSQKLSEAGYSLDVVAYPGLDHYSVLPPSVWDALVFLYGTEGGGAAAGSGR